MQDFSFKPIYMGIRPPVDWVRPSARLFPPSALDPHQLSPAQSHNVPGQQNPNIQFILYGLYHLVIFSIYYYFFLEVSSYVSTQYGRRPGVIRLTYSI